MAALHLDGRCAHALGEEAFQVGMNGAILGGNDGPARLRLPSGAVNLLVEQVRVGREVGGPDDLLLLLRKVVGEILNACLLYTSTRKTPPK